MQFQYPLRYNGGFSFPAAVFTVFIIGDRQHFRQQICCPVGVQGFKINVLLTVFTQ